MNTLQNTLAITGALFVLSFNLVQAQDVSSNAKAPTVVKQDKVIFDLATPAGPKDKPTFVRSASLAEDGRYTVVVKNHNGGIRMTGSYLDEALTIPDGTFTYYYPNESVESTGLIVNGLKSGTWLRYAMDGSPKAERNYTGKPWEELVVALGIDHKARTF